jgi:hypothetical protein
MFELLAPVFAVAGGLLAGVPLVLHMFRRTPALRMPFSVVRFLIPTLPTTTKRASIEHWPLMLLRILALALIGLAFARPFQRLTIARAAESGSADRIAVLIDASASMRRDGIRDSVLKEIDNVVASVNDEGTLSISVFSESTRSLLTAAEWRQTEPANRDALVTRVREAYDADWLSTQTATAMLATADEVAREEGAAGPDGERRVVLITDFQEGSQLDGLRAGTWPDSVKLDLRIVSPTESGNAGISLMEESRTGKLRVRVSNSGDAAVTKLQLSPFDSQGAPVGDAITIDVGGGQRRTISVPDSVEDQPRIVGYELLNEPHVFDNVIDLPLEEQQVIQVAHAGASDPNNADEMRYYLQRVLDGNETDPIEVVDLVGADGVAVPVPPNIRLAFVTDVVSEGLAVSLRTFVDNGGVLLIALKSVEMANSLKSFLPADATVEETAVDDYVMLGRLDFSSPLLSPFADARFADFSSIRFWHYRKLSFDEKQPDAPRVIGRFDSGAPAILQSVGSQNAKVFVLTAGWQPNDSQWALSTRFPPMILRLVQIANPRQSGYRLFEAGQRIYPQELTNAERWNLTLPDGSVRSSDADAVPVVPEKAVGLEADTASSPVAAESVLLDGPGRWMLNWETPEGPKVMSLLVTVPASESRTEPLPVGQLQALGMSSDVAAAKAAAARDKAGSGNAAQLDARELESQQKFWRWLLIAGLACLALEGIFAFLIERRHPIEMA